MANYDPATAHDIYNFATSAEAGGLVFLSGVVGSEADGTPPAEPARQFSLAFEALDSALAQAGRSRTDLVDLLTFHVGYPEHMEAFIAAKNTYLGSLKTCWTAIGVAAVATPGTLVEIRAVARA